MMMIQAGARDPYGQALSTLRSYADGGRFGWGEALVVKDLAEEIGLSPTPVREALARLAGEGLIERRRGRGYFFPAITAPDIIDLYGLQWGYLHAALTLNPLTRTASQKIAARANEITVNELCRTLVGLTANEAMATAYEQLEHRLKAVWRAEDALGFRFDPSAKDLSASIGECPLERTLELFNTLHSNRCEAASEIARFLQRSAGLKV